MILWSVTVGALLAFVALLLQRVAARVESVLRLVETRRRTARLPLGIILTALFLLGWRIGGEGSLAVLGALVVPVLIAVLPWAAALAEDRRPAPWALIGPTTASAMLFVGALLSVPEDALSLAGLMALGGTGWSLHRALEVRNRTGFNSI